MKRWRFAMFFVGLLCAAFGLTAQNVDLETYYRQAEGKRQAELKTALHEIARKGHRKCSYRNVPFDFFERYDLTPEGYIWDMYSAERYRNWSGHGMHREHCMPKSWFGVASGNEDKEHIGCDYHNLFPSNGEANQAKGNHPLGETRGNRFNNGTAKVGNNMYPGYSGVVFEPADEYKGDFARVYMYMVTRYEDYDDRWTSTGTKSMLLNNTYPTLNDYAVELLMEWHRQDPVSRKETDRNDDLYTVQGNRNPFVDYPELAEFLWGTLQNETWSLHVTYEDFRLGVADDVLTVQVSNREGGPVHYEIFGSGGGRMDTGTLAADGTVSVARLPAGMYVVSVYSLNKRYVGRFVK